MSTQLQAPAKRALVGQFNIAHRTFMEAATAAAPKMVEAINQSRVMGILLKELLARENITEGCIREWLHANPGLLVETEAAWLMNYVRVSNRMQGELRLFADAPREVVQMTMQCAGLLPPDAEREGVQQRHEPTPVSLCWKSLADLRVKMDGLFKAVPRWDDETRGFVKQQIEKTRAYLAELESKL